ncbi:flagellar basal-body rod protein FlgG [Myxococcota bacterium]|nr:flagellar basal-body rod protein FlgG [Myxococcota bacterium]MBU1429374.1 flagellar basal-body rod protein FlgG [Myxococcota bacterium]MBU1899545.1 flagellar basal-body rod protein FlgG [Myxococcota bacterium]
MLRSLHSAATGMEAQQTYIDVTANNLANVNTTGFKKSRVNFQDLMYQMQRAPGQATAQGVNTPNGVQVGLGVRVTGTQKDFGVGSFKPSSEPLHMAIEGPGFFQIRMPDGTVGYSRDGAFTTDENGQVVNSEGYPLEPPITIPPEISTVSVGVDGTVSGISANDAAAQQLGQIQLANFINPAGLMAQGGNILTETGASGGPNVALPGNPGFGALRGGALEGANVTVVEEMINLISAQRAFEFNSKAVQAADQMLREIGKLR